MPHNLFFKNPQIALLEKEFQKISDLNTQLTQLAFLKTLSNHGLLDLIIQNHKNPNCLKTLISIGYATQSHGLLLSMGAQCFAVTTALKNFSVNQFQRDIANKVIIGEKIAAFAATEIDAGSDVMAMKTHYTSENNKFILNGKKCYITNATSADYILVFATKNPKLYDRGLTLFLISSKASGVTIEPLDTTHTLKNSGLGNIFFENVAIDTNAIIGKECQAVLIFREALKIERSFILIPHIGTMLRWYHQCVTHIKTRIQFNKPLHQFQYISNKIIDMYERIKLSYLLAQDLFKNPIISDASSSVIKKYLSETLQINHQHTLSILSASGLFGDNMLSDNLLDSFASSIYSGTQEIQKNIILNTILDSHHDNFN